MNEFSKPTIEYAELWPLLLVFGVACAGVLVEAFVPRALRYLTQTVLTLSGLLVAFGGVVYVGTQLQEREGGVARGKIVAEGAIAIDGPTIFLWGLILLISVAGA